MLETDTNKRVIEVLPNTKLTIMKDDYMQILDFLDDLLNEHSIYNIKYKIRNILQKENK
jgi:hypothetical protein